jgi:hypothetical protein
MSRLAVLLLLGLTTTAAAEPISLVEADLGSGVLGVGFERTFAPAWSGRVTVQLERPWYTGILGGTESDVIGGGVEVRPFWFARGDAPYGLYVSPFARLALIRATDGLAEPATGIGWTAGITAGWGWRLGARYLLRLGAGVQYWAFEVDDGAAGVAGVYPDVDIVVGRRF